MEIAEFSGRRSFQDIVRPAFVAHLEQDAALDQIGQVEAQRLGRDVGTFLAVFPIGDALMLLDVLDRLELAFVHLAFPFVMGSAHARVTQRDLEDVRRRLEFRFGQTGGRHRLDDAIDA